MYSNLRNITQIYGLQNMIHYTKQRESSMTAYYNKIRSLWQGLGHYQHSEMEYDEDNLKLSRRMEQERIFEFIDKK